MDRFMLHLKNTGFEPKGASELLNKARQLSIGMNITIRDARVSTKYIEFDISVEKTELDSLVDKLKPIGILDHAKHVVEEKIEKDEAIKDGIFYFNNERFWECHEAFEVVWKNCDGVEKDLVQGIILVAAALVHYQKAENSICISVLGRALEKLEKSTGIYNGINVDRLRDKVNEIRNSKQITTFAI